MDLNEVESMAMQGRLYDVRKLKQENRAFTLIELLLVIAIIAVLVSMIFPAIAQTKGRAHRVQCASNLGQLSLALIMYADEYDDEYPRRATRRCDCGTWRRGAKSPRCGDM